jgi:hypothetical protein
MTRAEHLVWAKERALEYLPGDVPQAAASFISDLGKHPDLSDHAVKELIGMHLFAGLLDAQECRKLIEGAR